MKKRKPLELLLKTMQELPQENILERCRELKQHSKNNQVLWYSEFSEFSQYDWVLWDSRILIWFAAKEYREISQDDWVLCTSQDDWVFWVLAIRLNTVRSYLTHVTWYERVQCERTSTVWSRITISTPYEGVLWFLTGRLSVVTIRVEIRLAGAPQLHSPLTPVTSIPFNTHENSELH